MNKIDIMKVIENMEIGLRSCSVIRDLIIQNENNYDNKEFFKALDHHSMLTLDSFRNSISMLKKFDCDHFFVEKLDHCLEEDGIIHQYSPQISIDNGGRILKRKIGVESREEVVTQLSDDGFVWRKYGQKKIHNSYYPRNYYRCTHKFDLKCEATKLIQQISPTKYKIIYHGTHTCNKNTNFNNTQVEENSSSINFSFDGSNPVNPLLFQAFRSPGFYDPTILNNASQMSSNSGHEEIPSTEIENYSSTTVNLEEDYRLILEDFSELMPTLWGCC